MAKIWVIGSTAWDWVVKINTIPPPGGFARGRKIGGRPGGSPANIAKALSSAGHEVFFVGVVGNDKIGKRLVDDLRRWGVNTHYIKQVSRPSAQALILLDRKGERSIITLGGPEITKASIPIDELMTADCVYFENPSRRFSTIISKLKKSNILITSAPPQNKLKNWPANIIVGSETQFPRSWLTSPFQYIRQIAGENLRWVVVTRGANGATAYGPSKTIHVPAKRVKTIDCTGAGDAFTAGLLHGILQGFDIKHALELGVHWGTRATLLLQSVPPEWDEVSFLT